jgi:hypothetical protein
MIEVPLKRHRIVVNTIAPQLRQLHRWPRAEEVRALDGHRRNDQAESSQSLENRPPVHGTGSVSRCGTPSPRLLAFRVVAIFDTPYALGQATRLRSSPVTPKTLSRQLAKLPRRPPT